MNKLKRIVSCLFLLALVLSALPAVKVSAVISLQTFQERTEEFLADSRWKPGTPWVYGQRPKLSGWGSIGCCSFAADFVAYVYDSVARAWNTSDFTKFTDLEQIRTGDILHTSTHWFVVLERDGDTLYTAEGNYGSQVRLTREGWGLRDGKLYNLQSNSQVVFDCGYHYNFSDGPGVAGADAFTKLPGQMTVGPTDATLALRLNKEEGTSLTAYGARLFDAAGSLLGQVESTPGSAYADSTFVDMWYSVSKRFGLTLLPSTKYLYEFWATVDGQTLTSQRRSFTTSAAVAGTSASQIYYSVDLSTAALATKVPHRDGTDLAVTALACVEAYLYSAAAESDRELVYQAVAGKAAGADFTGAESWTALGYEKGEYSMQLLYDQLEQGLPALVCVEGEEGLTWALVCGYTGSTTKLESTGFIVLDVRSGQEKTTLDVWLGEGEPSAVVFRKNGIAVSGLSGGIRLAMNQPPVLHPYQAYHSVFGWVSSAHELTKVQVIVTSLSESKEVLNKTVAPDSTGKLVDLHSIDKSVPFSSWPVGKYYYTVLAWDAAGGHASVTRYFEIAEKWSLSKPNPIYAIRYDGGAVEAVMPDTQAVLGGEFTLRSAEQMEGTSFVGDAFLSLLTLRGWQAKRDDGKWYVDTQGWLTEEQITAGGYTKHIFPASYTGKLDTQWVLDSVTLGGYTLYGVWALGEQVMDTLSADKWYEVQGQWYFVSGGSSAETTLPKALTTVTDAKAAQTIRVCLGEGQSIKVNVPMSDPVSTNLALKHNADGTTTALETVTTETGVQVTLTESCTFTVVDQGQGSGSAFRVYGNDRYQTALKAADVLKEQLKLEKFDTVVVASGTEFADALSGSYLAAVKNAPMLLVRNNKTTLALVKEYITRNLNPGGTVYLLGGTNAVPQTMETGLEGFTVRRLGGNTRYDTNLLILQEAGVGDKDILICIGTGFADSLSASAAERPILLVKDSLNDAQKAFLKDTKGKKYIIGGTAAVSEKVEAALKSYGEVKRLGGNTRYETSVLVAKEFFAAPAAAVLAYAGNFPDGLSGGPLAAAMDAPLILTANGKDLPAAQYAKALGIRAGFVLGGTGLISDKTAKNLFSAEAIPQK